MSFRPEGHEKFEVSNYMKLNQFPSNVGDSKAYPIRILSEPINGYMYWIDAEGQIVPRDAMSGTGGKPVRLRRTEDFTREQISAMKMFAATIVWNYEYEKIQVLDISQTGIMSGLDGLYDSKAWGDITEYDIHIIQTKTGPEKKNVEYSVQPQPKTKVSKEILEAHKETPIDLEALFEGEDPFSGENTEKVDNIDL